MKLHFTLFITIITLTINAFGQKNTWCVGSELGSGFILKHNSKMANLANSHPSKYEFILQKQTSGDKEWHHQYNLPKIAYSLIIVDYNNPVIEKTYAANIQLIYPFINKNKFKFNSVIGLGLGYNTNPFDRVSNYKNLVFGSKLTGSMHVKLYTDINLTRKISSTIGIGLIHFSNGAIKLPNLGINVPYLNLGINYKIINGEENIDFSGLKEKNAKNKLIDISIGNGFKDVGYSGGKRYLFNVLSIKKHFFLNNTSDFVVGSEFFYDRSVNEFRINDGLMNDKNRNSKNSILVGYELRMSKVYAVINYGFYTYQAYNNVYASAYQRYQIKYQFSEGKYKFYSAIGLKVHKGVADVIEFTVGAEL